MDTRSYKIKNQTGFIVQIDQHVFDRYQRILQEYNWADDITNEYDQLASVFNIEAGSIVSIQFGKDPKKSVQLGPVVLDELEDLGFTKTYRLRFADLSEAEKEALVYTPQ